MPGMSRRHSAMMMPGMFLSQPPMPTRPSKRLPRATELDGVGDHFARDQRSLHSLRAHGDAVGDGDGVELHGRAAGFANAFFQSLGDFAQVNIACADFGPCIGDADDGLVQIFFAESGPAQIRARGGAAGAFSQRNALRLPSMVIVSFSGVSVARGVSGVEKLQLTPRTPLTS